jgi:hypothetical protein
MNNKVTWLKHFLNGVHTGKQLMLTKKSNSRTSLMHFMYRFCF